jgi:hypothetical protein
MKAEYVMKLNSAQVEQALTQLQALVLPDNDPAVLELNALFGDHTFFLDRNGLNVVEPNEDTQVGASTGMVVNLASWSDESMSGLAPHEPQPTEVVVMLEKNTD